MNKGQQRGRVMGGVVLIILGVIALIAQFVELGEWLGLLILPTLGVLFFVWGIVQRESGLMIPGGILTGLGIGTLLITGPFSGVDGQAQGGIFMLAFAFGWALIPIVSAVVTGDNHWWALIPGGIMGVIGAGLLLGGMAVTVLEILGDIWPVFLILLGLFLLLRRSAGKAA